MSARFLAKLPLFYLLAATAFANAFGQVVESALPSAQPAPGLRNANVLIIRHAEKPEAGDELTPEGFKRARAYADYFRAFKLDSQPLQLDWLIAAADSKSSRRPRLTLEPLSSALGLHLDLRFKAKQPEELAQEMRGASHGKGILICWHHGQIPNLLRALGAEPERFLPDGKWPNNVFSWIIALRFDDQGRLIPNQSKLIKENLLPGDASDSQDRP